MSIRAINPGKYALSLMDALFSNEEMRAKCFSGTSRSNKEALPKEKVKLIEGLLTLSPAQAPISARALRHTGKQFFP